MDIRLWCGLAVLAGALAIAPPVFAADEISPLPDLDACIAAALKERPGALFGWKELGVGSYKISVITADGKIGDASCSGSAPAGLQFENRFGLRRFEPYERKQVPEAPARATAALIFSGRVRFTQMEIDTDMRGGLSYEYHMELQSGHKVLARVDTGTGLLIYAEVKE
jgi:hypothetical protein